jgi:hypothetical protein
MAPEPDPDADPLAWLLPDAAEADSAAEYE